jgi:hypothetical protein
MALQVQLRTPRFRLEIFGRSGLILSNDIAPSVVDISVSKRMGDAGVFQIELLHRKPPSSYQIQPRTDLAGGVAETWADLINPMDLVTIWFAVDNQPFEIVMRGFVDTASVMVDNSSGRPTRRVVVAGRDYHKLLLQKFFLPPNAADLIKERGFFPEFVLLKTFFEGENAIHSEDASTQRLDPKTASSEKTTVQQPAPKNPPKLHPKDIMRILHTFFYVPQEDQILRTLGLVSSIQPFTGNPTRSAALLFDAIDSDALEPKLIAYNPVFTLDRVEPFNVIADFYSAYQHQPWRELYFEQVGPQTAFIYRPTPWLDINGDYFQGVPEEYTQGTLKTLSIEMDEIIRSDVSRNDDSVVNWIQSNPYIYAPLVESFMTTGSALESLYGKGNPTVIGIDDPSTSNPRPSSWRVFGFRPFIGDSLYFNPNEFQGQKQEQHAQEVTRIRQIGFDWNERLVRAFDHNELLESGELVIRGRTDIRIGYYVSFTTSKTQKPARAYVEGYTHTYEFPVGGTEGKFTTVLQLSRGRGYLASLGKAP